LAQEKQRIVINNSKAKILNPPVSTKHIAIKLGMSREVNHGMHFVIETIDCQFVSECFETAACSSDLDTKASLDP